MEPLQLHDRHLKAKSIVLGSLLIALGVVIYSNMLAKRAIDPIEHIKMVEYSVQSGDKAVQNQAAKDMEDIMQMFE